MVSSTQKRIIVGVSSLGLLVLVGYLVWQTIELKTRWEKDFITETVIRFNYLDEETLSFYNQFVPPFVSDTRYYYDSKEDIRFSFSPLKKKGTVHFLGQDYDFQLKILSAKCIRISIKDDPWMRSWTASVQDDDSILMKFTSQNIPWAFASIYEKWGYTIQQMRLVSTKDYLAFCDKWTGKYNPSAEFADSYLALSIIDPSRGMFIMSTLLERGCYVILSCNNDSLLICSTGDINDTFLVTATERGFLFEAPHSISYFKEPVEFIKATSDVSDTY